MGTPTSGFLSFTRLTRLVQLLIGGAIVLWAVVFVGDLIRPPNQSPPAQRQPTRLSWESMSEQSAPAVSSRSDAAEKISQPEVGSTPTARPLTEGLPSVFSSEQPAVTKGPEPASDDSLMGIFEKYRSEPLAKPPVPAAPSATPGASAGSSLLGSAAEVPKRPEGQGATAKIESKTKTKQTVEARKTAESGQPKPGATAALPLRDPGMKASKQPEGQGPTAKAKRKTETKQTAEAQKTAKPRKPKPKVVRQKKPKPNLSNPAAWSPTYHGTK